MKQPQQYVDRDAFLLDAVKGKKVLHLGCVGYTDLDHAERIEYAKKTLHWKLSQVAEVIGVDHCAPVVEEYKRLGVFDNIVVGDIEQLDTLPLPRDFDWVVAGDIIEHLSNPGLMLKGLQAVMNERTQLMITTPHAFGLPNFIRHLMGRFTEGDDHVMTFNVPNLYNLLNRYAFDIDQVYTCFQSLSRRKAPLVFDALKNTMSLVPHLGGTLILIARKNTKSGG